MEIDYTNIDGHTYKLKEFPDVNYSQVKYLLDPSFNNFGGPTKVVVHHADGSTETYAPRKAPERFLVEIRVPKLGDLYWSPFTEAWTRATDDFSDLAYPVQVKATP